MRCQLRWRWRWQWQWRWQWRWHRAGRRKGDQSGTSLVELVVAMVMLGIFLALCSTTLISMVRAVNKQSGVVDAQTSTRMAFLQLDKQIRYADSINTPGTIAGDQWIEWRVPDPTIPLVQSITQSRCYQWKASSAAGTLQFRSWVVPTIGGPTVSAWRTVASGLVITGQPVFTTTVAGLRAAPFSLPATGGTYGLGQGQVGVAMSVSVNNPAGRSTFATVFTALNTGVSSTSACMEVARA